MMRNLMRQLRGALVRRAERLTGTHIIPRGSLWAMPEREHLRAFFAHFGVDCVFDVGANEGQFADMLRRKVGYRGPILSFEPIPDVAERLKARAAADPLWFVEQVALADEIGERTFNIMADTQFSSLAKPSHEEVKLFEGTNQILRSIGVKLSTVEFMLEKYRKELKFTRPYLKMDTQGHDLSVVRGAGDSLRGFVGLQSELAIRKLYDTSVDFRDAITAYERAGFALSAFVPNNEGHFPALIEMDCIMYNTRYVPLA
ncbi:methyltransferase FkbM family [Methylobacterium sp. 4-46]|uniref:FkbM family methyltransferase n=1 Tax=unclassified Methylobacterium TaxID=2615210 RepID=UPI000152D2E3|nr:MULTISPECIES: FkbM family methyltransferase [Methylobacterium]ACA15608.1 methyltransferase FkbM family [Methylobacterium sp. 4-46]WFT81320.1 FkbM family methyltransferase [Methylobacterium nodulans]